MLISQCNLNIARQLVAIVLTTCLAACVADENTDEVVNDVANTRSTVDKPVVPNQVVTETDPTLVESQSNSQSNTQVKPEITTTSPNQSRPLSELDGNAKDYKNDEVRLVPNHFPTPEELANSKKDQNKPKQTESTQSLTSDKSDTKSPDPR